MRLRKLMRKHAVFMSKEIVVMESIQLRIFGRRA